MHGDAEQADHSRWPEAANPEPAPRCCWKRFERTGARWYEAEVHRLEGELLLARDASNAAQAEQSFRTEI